MPLSFSYTGARASGTNLGGSGPNLGAILGGTIGGVVGGISLIAVIVVAVVRRRRRNARIDDASAVHHTPVPASTFSATPYSVVPTAEYYDPYAGASLGPEHYQPSYVTETSPQPRWARTDQGPFGSGSYAAAGSNTSGF